MFFLILTTFDVPSTSKNGRRNVSSHPLKPQGSIGIIQSLGLRLHGSITTSSIPGSIYAGSLRLPFDSVAAPLPPRTGSNSPGKITKSSLTPCTERDVVTLEVPFTSRSYCGLVVLIPTLVDAPCAEKRKFVDK